MKLIMACNCPGLHVSQRGRFGRKAGTTAKEEASKRCELARDQMPERPNMSPCANVFIKWMGVVCGCLLLFPLSTAALSVYVSPSFPMLMLHPIPLPHNIGPLHIITPLSSSISFLSLPLFPPCPPATSCRLPQPCPRRPIVAHAHQLPQFYPQLFLQPALHHKRHGGQQPFFLVFFFSFLVSAPSAAPAVAPAAAAAPAVAAVPPDNGSSLCPSCVHSPEGSASRRPRRRR